MKAHRLAGFLAVSALAASSDTGYVAANACAECHFEISRSYRQTGMGRSFAPATAGNTFEGAYAHQLSGRNYRTEQRNGKFYQSRWQTGGDGAAINVLEKEIQYVIGSGNHARTYLHQTPGGWMVQMPLAWYSENGGYWAMSPGFDRIDPVDFRRKITNDCLFCHTSYPQRTSGDEVEGMPAASAASGITAIDCQRCHGPGRAHIDAVTRGAARDAIKQAIVNPKNLSRERQMELCMQCHLEPTSQRLPQAIRRFGRGVFSYRPGEALSDYILYFDHSPGAGRDEKFEINHAAYRLRKSACFERSGTMTCTTCHNPHEALRGEAAEVRYRNVCRACHSESLARRIAAGTHTQSADCVGCHMPKRRTDDIVHAVMTDHLIQARKPERNLMAPRAEPLDKDIAYTGEVALYYPDRLSYPAESELYLALAQVRDSSDLKNGIPRLRRALDRYRPATPEFYFELAQAYSKAGNMKQAGLLYEQSLRRRPGQARTLGNWTHALLSDGKLHPARKVVDQGLAIAPADPVLLSVLGELSIRESRFDDAITALNRAVAADPDLPEAHNALGVAHLKLGDRTAAEAAFRRAILVQPDFSQAHSNLAFLCIARKQWETALYHLQQAIRMDGENAALRFNYGVALAERGLVDLAREQLELALRLNPAGPFRDAARRLIQDLRGAR